MIISIRIDDETINRIKNYAIPITVKQLMAFNGLINWMRDYLPDIGEKSGKFASN